MLLLMVGSVVFMPLALPLLIPGLSADPWPLLRPLLFTMLLPLAAGMVVRRRSERWAARLRPVFGMVSNVSMILAVVLLIGLNFGAMIGTFGSGAVAVAVVFVALSLAVGYALGGPSPGTRSVLGLGTGQRNVAAALVIATQNFPDDPAWWSCSSSRPSPGWSSCSWSPTRRDASPAAIAGRRSGTANSCGQARPPVEGTR